MTQTADGPTVYAVDDDQAVRESLRWLIESAGWKVRVFASADEFLREYDPAASACLLLDVRLPGMSGLELQAHLAEKGRGIPIIMITGHGDVPMAVRAMKAGAFDFLEKPFSDQRLLERIRAALRQDQQLRDHQQFVGDVVERLSRLSKREREVLRLVVAGRLTKQIAQELKLSPKTVEVHRSHLMQKMRAETVADLVRMALQVEAPQAPAAAPLN